jgi:hypothetical protein
MVRFLAGASYCSFLKSVQTGCGSTQHAVGAGSDFSPGVQRVRREVDHSYPSIVNEWSCSSTSPYAFVACTETTWTLPSPRSFYPSLSPGFGVK